MSMACTGRRVTSGSYRLRAELAHHPPRSAEAFPGRSESPPRPWGGTERWVSRRAPIDSSLQGKTMKLIGMLDSPYVRRVAISLSLLGLRFEHQPLSVFRDFAGFEKINPVVKAPTLVCDDGEVLMDSTLIIQYAEAVARPRSLFPLAPAALQHDLHLLGLALAATEKSVQLVYERELRPAEKRHQPWVSRVTGQLLSAYRELEREFAHGAHPVDSATIRQAGVAVGVAWYFTQRMLPGTVPVESCPSLAAFSANAESLPEFRAAPYGDGTCRP